MFWSGVDEETTPCVWHATSQTVIDLYRHPSKHQQSMLCGSHHGTAYTLFVFRVSCRMTERGRHERLGRLRCPVAAFIEQARWHVVPRRVLVLCALHVTLTFVVVPWKKCFEDGHHVVLLWKGNFQISHTAELDGCALFMGGCWSSTEDKFCWCSEPRRQSPSRLCRVFAQNA